MKSHNQMLLRKYNSLTLADGAASLSVITLHNYRKEPLILKSGNFALVLVILLSPSVAFAAGDSIIYELIKAWAPFVVLIGIWIFYFARRHLSPYQRHMERAEKHMDKAEEHMQRTEELMKNIVDAVEKNGRN